MLITETVKNIYIYNFLHDRQLTATDEVVRIKEWITDIFFLCVGLYLKYFLSNNLLILLRKSEILSAILK